jgi:hypothetical protein
MKLLAIIFSLFLLTTGVAAQKDSTQLNSAWGATFGLGAGHRLLSNSNTLLQSEEEMYDSLEVAGLSYFGELTYVKRLNSHLRLHGSIGVMRMTYRIDSIQDAGIEGMRMQFVYGAIPIKLQYLSSEEKKVAWCSSFGVVPMFLLNQNTRVSYIGDSRVDLFDTQSDMKNFSLAAHVSSGIEAKVLENYRLTTELFFRQQLTPIAEGDLMRRLNAFGLSFSIIKTL